MLVESLKGGKGFSGKIDYLYEGKLEDRGIANKQAKVITYSDNLRVPYDYSDIKGRNRMKADFISQAQTGENGVPKSSIIGEHVMSFASDDRKKLTPEFLKEITDEYIKMAGLDKTQFVGISHNDTENFHVHILFNRKMNDGTMYKAWKEKNKSLERGIALALKHDFRLVGNQHRIADSKEVTQLRSEMSDIKELRTSDSLLLSARNLKHLEKMCETNNQEYHHDLKTGTVKLNQKEYKERDLKAVFMLNRNLGDEEKKKKSETIAAIRKENQMFSDVKSLGELRKLCNSQKVNFAVDAQTKTVLVADKQYQEKDLQNVFVENFLKMKSEVKEMKESTPILNTVKGMEDLKELCNSQKINFAVDAQTKTVLVADKQYQEKDLQNVFNENIRKMKSEVKEMKENNPILNSVKSMSDLKELCNSQKVNFAVDTQTKTVLVADKQYQEKDLQNLFGENKEMYMRYNPIETQSEYFTIANAIEKVSLERDKDSQVNKEETTNDYKIKPQITVKDETVNEAKKKRRKSGFKIKIEKIQQKQQKQKLSI